MKTNQSLPLNRFALAALLGIAAPCSGGDAEIDGERRCWHKVTLSVDGPEASETGGDANPFTDMAMTVEFEHEASGALYRVPGYFAADGDAGESGADAGSTWRAHFAPDKPGAWTYRVEFRRGAGAAVDTQAAAKPVEGVDGLVGDFDVEPTDKKGRDFRAHGRLQYVGERYLRFAETGKPFIKAGPDAPETLLAYEDFDGTTARKEKVPLKSWGAHVGDWRDGDPTWRGGKGKGLIGAMNYLASKGVNSVSFLPYNAGGDGDNVWPMVSPDDKLRYDCSKLDQWQVVFEHAQRNGVFLHFKLQETENDDNRRGKNKNVAVEAALDNGELGVERKLYLREIVARFGHLLALNWNLGEENTQSVEQQKAMARYLRAIDPYGHLVVLHTYPQEQDMRYEPHLGDTSTLTGASLQNRWDHAHKRTKQWVTASAKSGHAWVCCNDEQGPAGLGVPPDADYQAAPGRNAKVEAPYTQDDIRKQTLWGTLMAGGAGVEYYFGYQLAENDLLCEDFRSRDAAWDDCRRAIEFFEQNPLPLVEMSPADELVESQQGGVFCLAKRGEVYLAYLLEGGAASVDLSGADGEFQVRWYNPRAGGELVAGGVIAGGGKAELTAPTSGEDWLALVQRR